MKTLGEAALDLPWIAPSVASLTTLARLPFASAWPQVHSDPGIVLLSARLLGDHARSSLEPADLDLLDAVLHHLPHFDQGAVDWNQPGPNVVYRACYQHASLACQLAKAHQPEAQARDVSSSLALRAGVSAQQAWIAGFLAPLGWLALTAADPLQIGVHLAELEQSSDIACRQQQQWGHDHTAIARRLSRSWRLPAWLTAVIGHLGLHISIAGRLGADPHLFQLVQLAAVLIQQREHGLALSVGTPLAELLAEAHLSADQAQAIADDVLRQQPPTQSWEPLAQYPLLPEFLRLALDHRRHDDAAWIERLQQDLDRMQEALVKQCADDDRRLHAMKLSSMAEFAAGAGHEINNPLAVISGQAQYVLKQMEWIDGPADEIENVGEYLDNLRSMITPSLKKIIGQTQRIHAILTELMQFARPSTPKPQAISAAKLMHDAIESLQSFAQEHKVQLTCVAPAADAWIHVDPAQARIALVGLVKNAIEAAPADGWARVRTENERPGLLDVIVEDSGSGPPPALRAHLFDPFFSGRSAGRGRGMGLPTAWRLARQQGGDVRFDDSQRGVTRFVLTLPMAPPPNGRLEPEAQARIAASLACASGSDARRTA